MRPVLDDEVRPVVKRIPRGAPHRASRRRAREFPRAAMSRRDAAPRRESSRDAAASPMRRHHLRGVAHVHALLGVNDQRRERLARPSEMHPTKHVPSSSDVRGATRARGVDEFDPPRETRARPHASRSALDATKETFVGGAFLDADDPDVKRMRERETGPPTRHLGEGRARVDACSGGVAPRVKRRRHHHATHLSRHLSNPPRRFDGVYPRPERVRNHRSRPPRRDDSRDATRASSSRRLVAPSAETGTERASHRRHRESTKRLFSSGESFGLEDGVAPSPPRRANRREFRRVSRARDDDAFPDARLEPRAPIVKRAHRLET